MDFLPFVHPRSLAHLSGTVQRLIEGRLWLQVLVALVLGVGVGVALGPELGWVSGTTAETVTDWLALPGRLFLAVVQMIVIPLVVASIIRGLAAGEDLSQLRRIGVVAVVFFLVTTTASILLGVGLTALIRPGSHVARASVLRALGGADPVAPAVAAELPLPERIVQLVPVNPLGSMMNAEMLQIVLFSLIVGVALVSIPGSHSKPLLELLGSVQKIAMTIVGWAMRLIPLAVFGLLTQLTARVGLSALVGVGAYVLVVLAGVAILLVLYWLVIGVLLRRSPLSVMKALRDVQLLAFSTSSSAACMPVSIRTAEERLGVRPSVAQVVIPLGVTINMNGTALYQGAATVFLAQVFGIELGGPALALLVVTAVGASVGTPGTPGAGVVVLASVLAAAGVPVAGIGLILGVSRIVDMSVTVVNVTGDLAAASFIERRLAAESPARAEREAERAREHRRARSGEDVIVRSPARSAAGPRDEACASSQGE